MQNNEPNKFIRLWKQKGYYIVLGLCILAVGVSGYFFITGALREADQTEESLSIPVTVEEPKAEPKQSGTTATAETIEQDVQTQSDAASDVSESEPVSAEAALETADTAPITVMPVSGDVSRDYAMDRLVYHATTQDWRVHNGVDLAAEQGQQVRAAKNGTVTAVYDDGYYGTTVVIQHDGGYTSHYCNLAETTLVEIGQTVAAGDPIGSIGATALIEAADESHLHFEVYCNGESVDPAGFLY